MVNQEMWLPAAAGVGGWHCTPPSISDISHPKLSEKKEFLQDQAFLERCVLCGTDDNIETMPKKRKWGTLGSHADDADLEHNQYVPSQNGNSSQKEADGLDEEPAPGPISKRKQRMIQILQAKARKQTDRESLSSSQRRKLKAVNHRSEKNEVRLKLIQEISSAEVNVTKEVENMLRSSSALGGGGCGGANKPAVVQKRRHAIHHESDSEEEEDEEDEEDDNSSADRDLDESDELPDLATNEDQKAEPKYRKDDDSETTKPIASELKLFENTKDPVSSEAYTQKIDTDIITRTSRTRRGTRITKVSRAEANKLMGKIPTQSAIGVPPTAMTLEQLMSGPLKDLFAEIMGKHKQQQDVDAVGSENSEDDGEEEDEDENEEGTAESPKSEEDEDIIDEEEHQEDGSSDGSNVQGYHKSGNDPINLPQPPPGANSHASKIRKQAQESSGVVPQNSAPPRKPVAFYVHVSRTMDIQKERTKLPIFEKEQEIMEAIMEHDIVAVSGPTGSGKTTQIPQFLYEAGFGHTKNTKYQGGVIIAQPRRIAVISCAKRVATELNLALGSEVGFQVRHYANMSDLTKIRFVTDGILLRELESDFLLRKFSAVVLDEAHERSMNMDFLLTLLSRSVKLRREKSKELNIGPLKVIIMSATLDSLEFLTKDPGSPLAQSIVPIIKADSRQFPVTVHFSRYTNPDYVNEAYNKIIKIHKRLPHGHVLCFLTGKAEIDRLCKLLREAFARLDAVRQPAKRSRKSDLGVDDTDDESSDQDTISGSDREGEAADSIKGDGFKSESLVERGPVEIIPLYSLLSEKEQSKVFRDIKSKDGRDTRKIIVSTNVAETSITIPNVKYVIDSGRVKRRIYNSLQGGLTTSGFEVGWISKSSADQRSGRAGRTGPGHCYRLYSNTVFQYEFKEQTDPEIVLVPVDSLVLRLKALGIVNVRDFPLPSKPPAASIDTADALLSMLGAIDSKGKITGFGKLLSMLPIAPRPAKLIYYAMDHAQEYLACRVAAILAVGDMWLFRKFGEGEDGLEPAARPDGKKLWNPMFRSSKSEVVRKLWAVIQFEAQMVKFRIHSEELISFCSKQGMVYKTCLEAVRIARQLESEAVAVKARNDGREDDTSDGDPEFDGIEGKTSENDLTSQWAEGEAQEQKAYKIKAGLSASDEGFMVEAFLSAFPDHVARRLSRDEALQMGISGRWIRRAFLTPSLPNTPVYIGEFSIELDPSVEYICYSDIDIREVSHPNSRPGSEDRPMKRHVLRNVSVIHPKAIATAGANRCSFSEPMESPSPRYSSQLDQVLCHQRVFYGQFRWNLGVMEMDMKLWRETASKGSDKVSMSKMTKLCLGDPYLLPFRVFGIALLAGEVFPEMSSISSSLVLGTDGAGAKKKRFGDHKGKSAHSVQSSLSSQEQEALHRLICFHVGLPRVHALISMLSKYDISSRAELMNHIGCVDSVFLLFELRPWYSPNQDAELTKIWSHAQAQFKK